MTKKYARTEKVLAALAEGPKTNDQLQDVLETHSGDVTRLLARMRGRGLVSRSIEKGRAIYRLELP